jgi:hypothetical protein
MIKIKTKKGMENMTLIEFSRWVCLIEAYDFILEKADEMGVDFLDFIKPIAIEKYIEERFPSVFHDISVEHELGNI